MSAPATPPPPVLLLGATGTIGRATAHALAASGNRLACVLRPGSDATGLPPGATVLRGDIADPAFLAMAFADRPRAVVSCMASRTGTPRDARAIDHDAHMAVLAAARQAGTGQFVLLSAICVQKPLLAFQQAKLAFEAALQQSGLAFSIVRPTAFFKSLSGQIGRVKAGKPFLVFGDGRLTACKPISDRDLADFIAGCLDDPARANRILPIGGPGPAITPLDQGRMLAEAAGRPPRFRHVPVALLDAIAGGLSLAGRVSPRLAEKAELARIGRYYATESMLAWDAARGRYDADATPEWGRDTLAQHYAAVLSGTAEVDLGAHAVFGGGP